MTLPYPGCRIFSMKLTEAEPPPFTIVLFNIKNFKLINENFGTEQGDKTLRYVYETLSGMLKPGEIVARSSADNFFLCLKEHSREVISARLEEMTKELNRFSKLIETPYHLTVLKGAYIVAVKNATPEVKAAADYVTEHDNNHNAIAEVIERFIL